MFYAMEMELREHLTIDKAVLGQNQAATLVKKLSMNLEVQFHWNDLIDEHSHVPEESMIYF